MARNLVTRSTIGCGTMRVGEDLCAQLTASCGDFCVIVSFVAGLYGHGIVVIGYELWCQPAMLVHAWRQICLSWWVLYQ